MMKPTLWTRNFTLLTAATVLGAAGSIASGFALSFLVFDETGSTLASALILSMRVIPGFVLPLFVAPWMDRLPRKPFLVGGDAASALLFLLAGLWIKCIGFSYLAYLGFSLLLSCIGAFDSLAYDSIYPKLIPAGMEEKGYAVSAMVYPLLNVVMMPVAALLYERLGVGNMLLMQSGLSLLSALTESGIRIEESSRMQGEHPSLRLWWRDVRDAAAYFKREKGLRALYTYMAATNGVAAGYGPLLVAFFQTTPGLTTAMYSLFTAAEFVGRTLGSAVLYRVTIPPRKKFGFAFFVYNAYELMDMLLLLLPYPLMLCNRAACGFLGVGSATLRQAAVQKYLPDEMRARISSLQEMMVLAATSVLSLLAGALGEVLPYPACMALCAGGALAVCWLTVFRNRAAVRRIYESESVK